MLLYLHVCTIPKKTTSASGRMEDDRPAHGRHQEDFQVTRKPAREG
jgi:hypothetical protein